MISRKELTTEYTRNVCKWGQLSTCCRYLTIDAQGWGCEKHTALRAVIDARVAAGTFTAKGDNCEGVAPS